MRLPTRVAHLFWDCDIELIDPYEHAPFVLSRTMCRMEHVVVTWLRQTYPTDILRSYLFNDGARKFGPLELDYWCTVLEVEDSLRSRWLAAAQARACFEEQPLS